MGESMGFKAFTASIIGGIGSVPGAIWGGLILGIAENLGAGYISSAFRDSFSFGILILLLLLKPRGLFGKQ
jgi:branched-chain amino acid transport system permease protein